MSFLRRIRAHWWGLAYLSLIPGCASVYDLLPKIDPSQFHFYHSTSQYEKSLYKDASVVISDLQSSISDGFKNKHSSQSIVVNGWNISINDLVIRGIKTESDDKILVEFRWQKLEKNTPDGKIGSYGVRLKAVIPVLGSDSSIVGSGIICKPLEFDSNSILMGNNERIDITKLFPYTICLSEQENLRLKGFWRSARGFPTDTSDSFLRMLYFSAITATTVGYGDIYPISNTARMVVTFETVAGVVLIGLFLNALFQSDNSTIQNEKPSQMRKTIQSEGSILQEISETEVEAAQEDLNNKT